MPIGDDKKRFWSNRRSISVRPRKQNRYIFDLKKYPYVFAFLHQEASKRIANFQARALALVMMDILNSDNISSDYHLI